MKYTVLAFILLAISIHLAILPIYQSIFFLKKSNSDGIIFKSVNKDKYKYHFIKLSIISLVFFTYALIQFYSMYYKQESNTNITIIVIFIFSCAAIYVQSSNKDFYVTETKICSVTGTYLEYNEDTQLGLIQKEKNNMYKIYIHNLKKPSSQKQITGTLYIHEDDLERFKQIFKSA